MEQSCPQWTTSVYLIYKNGNIITLKKGVDLAPMELYPYSKKFRLPTSDESLTLEKAVRALSTDTEHPYGVSESYPVLKLVSTPGRSCNYCGSGDYNPSCPECTSTGGGHPEYCTLREYPLPSGVSRYEFTSQQWDEFKDSGLAVTEIINLVDEAGYLFVFKPADPCRSCGATWAPNEMCPECWEHSPVPAHFELVRKDK